MRQDETKIQVFKNEYLKKLDEKVKLKIENLCRQESIKPELDQRLSRVLITGRSKNMFKAIMDVIT